MVSCKRTLGAATATAAAALIHATVPVAAFVRPSPTFGNLNAASRRSRLSRPVSPPRPPAALCALPSEARFEKIDPSDDQVITFLEVSGEQSIDCYVDSYATLGGAEYTIGSPCDYAVALCYFDGDDQLVPVELDEPLMDDIFPVAEGIIEEEFGEELVLLRTPQTLTLVGELDDSDEDGLDDEEGVVDSEEEVEILVTFEEGDREYHLVRLLDPVLLVGKMGSESTRMLLTPEESDLVMPQLEEIFLNYQDEMDGM